MLLVLVIVSTSYRQALEPMESYTRQCHKRIHKYIGICVSCIIIIEVCLRHKVHKEVTYLPSGLTVGGLGHPLASLWRSKFPRSKEPEEEAKETLGWLSLAGGLLGDR